jgi:RNA polymerase sigma-70 factor (ECF subfamily)
MAGRGQERADVRPVVYCIMPRELAPQLHEPLRKHFRDDAGVRVVVERRAEDRRGKQDRRTPAGEPAAGEDRRRIRALTGRRVAERRAQLMSVKPPSPLPRKVRPHAAALLFVERLEPSTEHAEEIETARLVMRAQSGDGAAFTDLYMRYFPRVYAYLRVVFRNEHQAEEATQHVFAKLFEIIPRYERRQQRFTAWLFVVVRNHALNEIERVRRQEPTDPVTLADETLGSALTHDEPDDLPTLSWISDPELILFVERLPLVQRQALILRYMLDLSTPDVARILGRSEEDVRQLQSRGLRFLRQRLTALGRGPATRTRARSRGLQRTNRIARRRRFALLGN